MSDALNRLRSELAGRYEVEQELGHGGMAVVYLARDLRHDRKVAIKVLRQGVTAGAERFLREIRTVAQLHHPHILQLLESGTAGDHLFYVMPYVEGETIRQRLERTGPLPVAEAVLIAREIADGLAFAHERGIVHRDIKPENIFLAAGHALVADFGIARAADAAAGATTTLTDAGLAVGTPSYMSPEQATAEPKLDGRSDQYALGCVLYEMLAGAPPFTGPTSQAIMARHTVDPVPPLRTVREVPVALESAITRALAKMPADRWPNIEQFASSLTQSVATKPQALRWRWAALTAALVLLALGLGRTLLFDQAEATPVAVAPTKLAVLPFDPGGDTAHSLLAEGMTDGVLVGLSRVSGLGIQQASRVQAYRRRSSDPREVGREMQVDAVVTATLRVSGNIVRVTPILLDIESGSVLWTERFDAELIADGRLQDVFSIQDEIAQRIVRALQLRLTPVTQAAVRRGVRTTDPLAYDYYLRARRLRQSLTKPDLEKALRLLDSAIARDSLFSDAWLDLATTYDNYSGYSSLSQAELYSRQRRATNRAIALDSLNGEALDWRSWNLAQQDWDWDGARRDGRLAVQVSPGSAAVALGYSYTLYYMSELDSARWYAERAIALEPTNAGAWQQKAWLFYLAGQLDSAAALLDAAMAIDSSVDGRSHYLHAQIAIEQGDRVAALRSLDAFLEKFGSLAQGVGNAAMLFHELGDRDGVAQMRSRLDAVRRQGPFGLETAEAQVRLANGDRAGALDALEAGARNHDALLLLAMPGLGRYLSGEPRFDAVRRQVFGPRPVPQSAPR